MVSLQPSMIQEPHTHLASGTAVPNQEIAEPKAAESAHQDSDSSSVSEYHVRQAAAVLEMSEQDSQADGTQLLEMSAEGGASVNLNNLTASDLSQLVSRLYGLVNSLQNENEQVCQHSTGYTQ